MFSAGQCAARWALAVAETERRKARSAASKTNDSGKVAQHAEAGEGEAEEGEE
jgi:hypothetical protein